MIRSAVGGGVRFGAIHSQMPAPWFGNVPGLKIVAPATPADAKGLLLSSIRDPNPVLFLEHKHLYGMKGAPGDGGAVPLGSASVVRRGRDLTIAAAMKGVHEALTAAEDLAGSGIECEVIDLRTLRPFDIPTVVESVERTGRLLVVEEAPRTGGWAGELVARSPSSRSARSMTSGGWPRPTTRSRSARRWRTRSSSMPTRSRSPYAAYQAALIEMRVASRACGSLAVWF